MQTCTVPHFSVAVFVFVACVIYVVQSELARQSSNKKKESKVYVGGKLRPNIVVSSNFK